LEPEKGRWIQDNDSILLSALKCDHNNEIFEKVLDEIALLK